MISSGLFVYKNVSQFELALHTSLIVIAGFQCGGMVLGVGLKMDKVKALHIKLQEIVDKSTFLQMMIFF